VSDPYIGEIRMFGGNFPPNGWAFCNGQTMPISENDALFTLIGTTYGGDGQETFNLPNLQGRIPLHQGGGFQLAESAGVSSVTLTTQQIPTHSHTLVGSNATAAGTNPAGTVLAHLPAAGVQSAYGSTAPFGALDGSSIGPVGGSQPHDNMQPYLVVNFIISLFGIFPHQS